MHRQFYLSSALDQLIAQGKIRRPSRAHSIVRAVIAYGAGALSDEDRRVYDIELVPMIERSARF